MNKEDKAAAYAKSVIDGFGTSGVPSGIKDIQKMIQDAYAEGMKKNGENEEIERLKTENKCLADKLTETTSDLETFKAIWRKEESEKKQLLLVTKELLKYSKLIEEEPFSIDRKPLIVSFYRSDNIAIH